MKCKINFKTVQKDSIKLNVLSISSNKVTYLFLVFTLMFMLQPKYFFIKVFMAQRKLNPNRKWCWSILSLAAGKKWEEPWNPRTYEMLCWNRFLHLTWLRFGAFLNCELYYLNRWILDISWSHWFFQTCPSTSWFHSKTINRSGIWTLCVHGGVQCLVSTVQSCINVSLQSCFDMMRNHHFIYLAKLGTKNMNRVSVLMKSCWPGCQHIFVFRCCRCEWGWNWSSWGQACRWWVCLWAWSLGAYSPAPPPPRCGGQGVSWSRSAAVSGSLKVCGWAAPPRRWVPSSAAASRRCWACQVRRTSDLPVHGNVQSVSVGGALLITIKKTKYVMRWFW